MPKRKEEYAPDSAEDTHASKKRKSVGPGGNDLKRAEGKTPVNTATPRPPTPFPNRNSASSTRAPFTAAMRY